jgi:hypothetical protein
MHGSTTCHQHAAHTHPPSLSHCRVMFSAGGCASPAPWPVPRRGTGRLLRKVWVRQERRRVCCQGGWWGVQRSWQCGAHGRLQSDDGQVARGETVHLSHWPENCPVSLAWCHLRKYVSCIRTIFMSHCVSIWTVRMRIAMSVWCRPTRRAVCARCAHACVSMRACQQPGQLLAASRKLTERVCCVPHPQTDFAGRRVAYG